MLVLKISMKQNLQPFNKQSKKLYKPCKKLRTNSLKTKILWKQIYKIRRKHQPHQLKRSQVQAVAINTPLQVAHQIQKPHQLKLNQVQAVAVWQAS